MAKRQAQMGNKISPNITLREKIGQCFMPAAFINDSEAEVQALEALIRDHAIGSICFFHSRASAATNFEGKKEVVHNEKSYDRLLSLIERYQKAAKFPLLIAIDAEWGLAMRIENTPQYPYALTLGAMQNRSDLVFEVGKQIGLDCKKAGIHWNLAPCIDINLNPENPVIGYRSFGQDREQVTQYAQAYIEGMQASGILNSIKHFPGHGDTAVDSHLGLPKIDKDKKVLLEEELYPFIKLIKNGIDSVMVGHLAIPALSYGKSEAASISKDIITGFLRVELGFEGLVISDALNMHAITKDFPQKGAVEYEAFNAGNDILCFADHVVEGIEKIMAHCSEERIEDSFQRVQKLKEKAFYQQETSETNNSHQTLMLQLAEASLTVLKSPPGTKENFLKNTTTITIGDPLPHFLQQLAQHKKESSHNILGINPRQVKPKNQFGFSSEELEKIQSLINTGNTLVFLFGNPFALDLFDCKKALGIVVAYQNFNEFQEAAAQHYLGNLNAKGKLPITLKNSL